MLQLPFAPLRGKGVHDKAKNYQAHKCLEMPWVDSAAFSKHAATETAYSAVRQDALTNQ